MEHRYGDDAFAALSDVVREAKGGDPLRPVTVVVDRGILGLATRRRLAAERGGVANVSFVRWDTFAAGLAAARLSTSAMRVATPALELEAVRSVLATGRPARLAAARDQPGTLQALARTYRELASLSADTLADLARQSQRAADVVAVVRATRARLARWADREGILRAAAAEVLRDPAGARQAVGTVVVYLPRRVGPPERELLKALAAATALDVVVGTTGDEAADEGAHALAADLHGGVGEPVAAEPHTTGAFRGRIRVCSAPTADAEVLMALRHLMLHNERGTRHDRMALLHNGAAPYAQLVDDLLRNAGIPAHGGGPRVLSATVPGRTLVGALSLGDRDWRRDDVMAWLASGPLRFGGRPVPAGAWDALSCEAGIVSGLDDWDARLRALAASKREEARLLAQSGDESGDASTMTGASDDPGPSEVAQTETAGDGGVDAPHVSRRRPAAVEREAKDCEELRELVADLSGRFHGAPATWGGWASWSLRLLEDFLGTPARRIDWPTEEVAAFDAVTDALRVLDALDWLEGPAPGLADFRAAAIAELEAPAPRTARFGRGLLAGRVADAVGLDLDVVCVVGMSDGAFPSRSGDDVLLPDRERERAGPAVPLRGLSRAEGRRDFFAALAGSSESVLFFPRGDQRTGRQLRPARLVLEALEHLAGDERRLYASDVESGPPEGAPDALVQGFEVVPSYAASVRGAGRLGGDAVSVPDWKLRSLVRWRWDHRGIRGHFLTGEANAARPAANGRGVRVLDDRYEPDEPDDGRADAAGGAVPDAILTRALETRAARRSSRFTRFDGLVEGLAVPSPAEGAVMSATRLESYARCPRQYLFDRLLDVTVRERPEAVVQLSPLERGTLMHRVLERLVREEIARNAAIARGDAGTRLDGHTEERMRELAAEEFDALERRGVSGHRVLWELEQARILSDLRQFLRQDAAYRRRTGAVPVAVEARFGWDGEAEVAVAVGVRDEDRGRPARSVRFRGSIDRVDRVDRADGIDQLGTGGAWGGAVLGVIDYKTGKAFGAPPPDDPVDRGTRLQLPIYAVAARAVLDGSFEEDGGDPARTRAGYWFVGTRAEPTWITVDADVRARFGDVVTTMVDGIEAGLFPANPGWTPDEPGPRVHCRSCAFSAMCPPRRGEEWDRKQDDPRLSKYVTMSRPSASHERR